MSVYGDITNKVLVRDWLGLEKGGDSGSSSVSYFEWQQVWASRSRLQSIPIIYDNTQGISGGHQKEGDFGGQTNGKSNPK